MYWAYKKYKANKAAKEEKKQAAAASMGAPNPAADPPATQDGQMDAVQNGYSVMSPCCLVYMNLPYESKCQTSCTARSSLRSSSLSFSLSSTHTRLSVVPFPPAMASPDVVAAALLLPIPLLSLALSLYNYLVHRSTPIKAAVLLFLAILAAVSGGTALSVACGEPLRIVAKVFTNLLHAALSAVSIYALGPSSQTHAFPLPFLGFFLSLAALLVACELVTSLIPTSPLLLSALLALVSRGILLILAIATAVLLRRRHAAVSPEVNVEKGRTPDESSGKTPGRVSSPTQATWPFPGSLALQDQPHRTGRPANEPTPPNFPPSSTFTRTHEVDEHAHRTDRQNLFFSLWHLRLRKYSPPSLLP
ncbi:hypothetical protein JVT61DRAFT_3055 [Boletus reticuloceps]|uniref:Transmembrane protein n=1 Tax=Boletus reticuloceps TaxID=495285 RepID=A0A8I3A8A8_9AGAM|nr:hypothetical protein JVT61DRAFT_3055 [Boletus reticuloceps]